MGQILLPLKLPVPNRYLAYYYFREKNIHYSIKKHGYMFCRPSHDVGVKLEKLQISLLIIERHFGFLNMSNISGYIKEVIDVL